MPYRYLLPGQTLFHLPPPMNNGGRRISGTPWPFLLLGRLTRDPDMVRPCRRCPALSFLFLGPPALRGVHGFIRATFVPLQGQPKIFPPVLPPFNPFLCFPQLRDTHAHFWAPALLLRPFVLPFLLFLQHSSPHKISKNTRIDSRMAKCRATLSQSGLFLLPALSAAS